jgi:hypothetical protein
VNISSSPRTFTSTRHRINPQIVKFERALTTGAQARPRPTPQHSTHGSPILRAEWLGHIVIRAHL